MINRKLVYFLGAALTLGAHACEILVPESTNKEIRIESENTSTLNKKYNYSDEDLAKFDSWIEQTIEESINNNAYSIIINKAEYKLSLIKNGKLHSQYSIELGRNPFNDKRMEGDNCTPEGLYEVIAKEDKGQTVFYRAFLINYPNETDKKEFRELKEKGLIPSGASIGSDIEIHGTGSGKAGNEGGVNWTLGCVALSNKDVDKIFDKIKKGTPVTIVRYSSIILEVP